MTKIVLRAEARADALDAYDWYESQSEGLGEKFRDAVDATLGRALVNPESYAPGHRGLRRALVRRFPYGIYFRLIGDVLFVVGIIHLKRHPRIPTSR